MLLENELRQALINYTKTRDEELKNKIVNYITKTDIAELKKVLYNALVPDTGKAGTIAGEMIRAVNRIGYRFFNDGDTYFAGYGLETAGSSAVYLSTLNNMLKTLLIKLYPENYLVTPNPNESYKNLVMTLETRIINLIQKSPDLLLKRNTIDSNTQFTKEAEELFKEYDEILFSDDTEDDIFKEVF